MYTGASVALLFLLLITGMFSHCVPALILFLELLQKVQAVQTDSMTEDLGVNTDPEWESKLAAMFQHDASLAEQYASLIKNREDEEGAQNKDKQELQKKKEEATRQHQVRHAHEHCVSAPRHCNRIVFYHQTVTVLLGSPRQTGVCAS